MKVYAETFASLEALHTALNSRPTTAVWRGRTASHDGDTHFTGTRSWAEACGFMLHGWDGPVEQIRAETAEYAKVNKTQNVSKNVRRNNICGHGPNVGRYLQGHPMNMVEVKKTPLPTKTIAIVYDPSASGSVAATSLLRGGITILCAVLTLESMGYRVRLDVMSTATDHTNVCAFRVPVKGYQQALNLRKVAFPLANPSMLRRMDFAWMETFPGLPESFVSGYGTPLHRASQALQDKALAALLGPGENYITTADISASGYDPSVLLEAKGIIDRKVA